MHMAKPRQAPRGTGRARNRGKPHLVDYEEGVTHLGPDETVYLFEDVPSGDESMSDGELKRISKTKFMNIDAQFETDGGNDTSEFPLYVDSTISDPSEEVYNAEYDQEMFRRSLASGKFTEVYIKSRGVGRYTRPHHGLSASALLHEQPWINRSHDKFRDLEMVRSEWENYEDYPTRHDGPMHGISKGMRSLMYDDRLTAAIMSCVAPWGLHGDACSRITEDVVRRRLIMVGAKFCDMFTFGSSDGATNNRLASATRKAMVYSNESLESTRISTLNIFLLVVVMVQDDRIAPPGSQQQQQQSYVYDYHFFRVVTDRDEDGGLDLEA